MSTGSQSPQPQNTGASRAAGISRAAFVVIWNFISESKAAIFVAGAASGLFLPKFVALLPQSVQDTGLGDAGSFLWAHPLTTIALIVWVMLTRHFYREWRTNGRKNLTTVPAEWALALGGIVLAALAFNEFRGDNAALSEMRALVAEMQKIPPEAAKEKSKAVEPVAKVPVVPKFATPATPSLEIDQSTLWAIGQDTPAGALAYVSWFRKANPDQPATLSGYRAMVARRRETLKDAPKGWLARQQQILLEMGVTQKEDNSFTYSNSAVGDACVQSLQHLGFTFKK